ncbi:MAG: hypothetical protein ACOQNY_00200 [Mycoplasmoidaceae bacterium]
MGIFKRKPKAYGMKSKRLSIAPIVFSSILAGGALAGSGVSIWQVAKNFKESPEFTQSVTGRIKIDPAFAEPKNHKNEQKLEEAEAITKECAEKLSRWLKDQGQTSYDVSYEVYEKTAEEDQYWGYLNAKFELDKVKIKRPISEEEEDKKVDNDPYLSYFQNDGFNSNEKTLVYRWYCGEGMLDDKYIPRYTIIPFRDVFRIPKSLDAPDTKTKVLVDKDGNNGVMYAVENQSLMNDIFKNLSLAKDDSQDEDKKAIKEVYNQPRLYIVNNLEGLYNEANYHISNYWAEEDEYRWWYDSTNYQLFSEKYKNKTWKNEERKATDKPNAIHLDSVDLYNGETKPDQKIVNADIFNYIDNQTAGTVAPDAEFTQKYINEIVTMDEIDNFMPAKITDDYKNDTDKQNPKISYFWYQQATKSIAQSVLSRQVTYGFNKARVAGIDFTKTTTKTGKDGAIDILNQFRDKDCQTTYIEPTFVDSIFGGQHLVGILSLGFLIFLVALLIILAVLYRTTGIMSWICLMFALSMSLLIATSGSAVISMSMLFGLFTIAIAGFISCLAICGRLRRRLFSREDTQVMINKAFKKSLLPVLDVSIISLIFGVCFIYIAPISLNALGLMLVIGAFANFISIYLFNGLLHGLFFNNRRMINKYQFFGKPSNIANEALTQGHNVVPTTMDATSLQIPFYSSMSHKKIDTTGKKALIAVAIVGALLIASIVLFSVLGFTSSSMFHTESCIVIFTDKDVPSYLASLNIPFISYRHDVANECWYIYTNLTGINLTDALNRLAAREALDLTVGVDIWGQHIYGFTNQDILNGALISVIVATICCAIYSGFRYNWLSLVPMFAGACAMPLITLGIASACQIKFDQFVVMGYVLTIVVNTIYCATMAQTISESWSRKDGYTKPEFKFIVNTALANNWQFIWTTALANALFIVAFAVTAPLGLNSLIYLLVIACVVSMVLAPFVMAFLIYQFMKVRNAVLFRRLDKLTHKVEKNWDDIDEQSIEGINKFAKKVPIVSDRK